jgi:hypothetical protein
MKNTCSFKVGGKLKAAATDREYAALERALLFLFDSSGYIRHLPFLWKFAPANI